MRWGPLLVALACAACSLFPDTAPQVQSDAGAGAVAGTGALAGSGGTAGSGTGGTSGGTGGTSGGTGGTSGGTGGTSGTGGADGGGTGGAAGCGPTQTLTLEASRDTYLAATPPTSTHGAEGILSLLTWNAFAGERPMIAFALGTSTLPSGTTLLKATLKLKVLLNDGVQQDVGAHRVLKAWTESASWTKFDGASSWAKNGGDFALPTVNIPAGPGVKVGDSMSWDVTPDVAGAIGGTLANDGWLLKPLTDEPFDGEKLEFGSREAGDPLSRPKLELAYATCK